MTWLTESSIDFSGHQNIMLAKASFSPIAGQHEDESQSVGVVSLKVDHCRSFMSFFTAALFQVSHIFYYQSISGDISTIEMR